MTRQHNPRLRRIGQGLGFTVLLLLMLGGTRIGPPVSARPRFHPAPSVIHDFVITLNEDAGEIWARFMVSPPLVPQVFRIIDTNGDRTVSAEEQQVWVRSYLTQLRITVDDQPMALNVTRVSSLSQEQFLLSMRQAVSLTVQFPYTLQPAEEHRFTLTDATNYIGYDEYYVSYADGLGSIVTSNESKGPGAFTATFVVSGPTSGAPLPPPAASPSVASGVTPASALFLDQFRTFLHDSRADPRFGLLIFLLAVGVGGLHALQPGHGKAMVAAYLVGSRGRVGDAVLLGSVVTVTHTSSVVLLGLALLFIDNFALPRAFQPALELLSGALIVGLGGWLLGQRWRALRLERAAPDPPGVGKANVVPAPLALDPDYLHPSTQRTDGHHSAAHGDPPHPHATHPHTHAGHTHPHVPPPGASLRDLIGLGVSGGLVPCPEAITILLLAAGVGQVGLGIALVSSFSVGLAVVLIVIGILLVKGRGLLERLLPGRTGPTWARWLPIVSAAVVIVLGVMVMLGALGQRWS